MEEVQASVWPRQQLLDLFSFSPRQHLNLILGTEEEHTNTQSKLLAEAAVPAVKTKQISHGLSLLCVNLFKISFK